MFPGLGFMAAVAAQIEPSAGSVAIVSPDAFAGTFSRASTATTIAADDASVVTVAANTPRFSGAARDMVLEGGRSNEVLRSQTFSDAAWALTGGATKDATNLLAPDGTNSGATITFPAAAASFYQNIANLGANPWTVSAWLRSSTSKVVRLALYNGSTYQYGPEITLTPAWTRYSMYFVAPGTTQAYAIVQGNTPTAGSFDVWGMQLVLRTARNSYIPTTTAIVTRAVESASYPINATQGTVYGAFAADGTFTGFQRIAIAVGSSGTEYAAIRISPTANTLQLIRVTGGTTTAADLGAYGPDTFYRFALGFSGSSAFASLNGGAVVSIAGGAVSPYTGVWIGSETTANNQLYGLFRNIRLLPTRVADADLRTLAT